MPHPVAGTSGRPQAMINRLPEPFHNFVLIAQEFLEQSFGIDCHFELELERVIDVLVPGKTFNLWRRLLAVNPIRLRNYIAITMIKNMVR